LRLRLTADEAALLKATEVVYGAALARQHDPAALRESLALMKAAHKVSLHPGSLVVLGESDASVLLSAVHHAHRGLERYRDVVMGWQSSSRMEPEEIEVLERAFPAIRGSAWETSRLARSLTALAERLAAPLSN
jgi:hypothetical protein